MVKQKVLCPRDGIVCSHLNDVNKEFNASGKFEDTKVALISPYLITLSSLITDSPYYSSHGGCYHPCGGLAQGHTELSEPMRKELVSTTNQSEKHSFKWHLGLTSSLHISVGDVTFPQI